MRDLRILTAAAVLAPLAVAAGPASADSSGPVAIDFTMLGTRTVFDVYQESWVRLNATDFAGNPKTFQFTEDPNQGVAKGLGIVGGLSDLYVDGDERIVINLEDGVLAQTVLYYVGDATNGDADGQLGEATVRAWGPCDNLYQPVQVSGEGTINVSALFGNVPLNRVTITPRDGDAFHIYDLSVTPAGVETIIDFEIMGTFQTSIIDQDGFVITAFDIAGQPGTLSVFQNAGLGVVGGPSDVNIDSGETVRVDFGGSVPLRTFYQVLVTCDNDNDGLPGERRIVAWGPNGHILSSFNTWGTGVFDVNGFLSPLPIRFYTILGRDTDCLRVRRMSYLCPMPTGPAPGACKADINGDGQTNVLDFAELADDFGCDDSE